jgi:hypothetical protein
LQFRGLEVERFRGSEVQRLRSSEVQKAKVEIVYPSICHFFPVMLS